MKRFNSLLAERMFIISVLFLFLLPSAAAFERSKVIGGNFTNPLHAEVPPEYRAEWVEFIFDSNETCNASAFYRVYQYGEVVKEGSAEVRWLKNRVSITIPLEIYDEFTVHLFPDFSCNATPERYMIFETIDFRRLTSLKVETERTVETLWKGKAIKASPLKMDFNIPGELLGVEAELYDYKGKFVYVTLSWDGFKKNLTLPVVNSRVWIPGQNASGKIRLILDLPRNVFVSATAYYLTKRKPVNEDLLRNEEKLIRFEYPLGGMIWDEVWLKMLFMVNGDGELIVFDFGNDKRSKMFISKGKVCVNLYTRYSERKKECWPLGERNVHYMIFALNRREDGTRYLRIKVDDLAFSTDVNSGIRLWYLGSAISPLSFDASLRRNPSYYVVPPEQRRISFALGLSFLALSLSTVSIFLVLRRR
ncbi:hypothetical protein [Thermococcus barophilus]|uniref:Uncharacterized protein n=1 Tax=Thermococcus barophilus (strain DSM 11836 / MP) TaxID=391623 RepID=F0LMG0_THEBM|nr:hypothetical protein [Thermococcus barophilus]ADT85183.1 hypothetical protein TERMP_02209 [Thermococcus barophilus MP]